MHSTFHGNSCFLALTPFELDLFSNDLHTMPVCCIFEVSLKLSTEAMHNVPVNQMGNYQERLRRMQNLRSVDTDDTQPSFGNPYRRLVDFPLGMLNLLGIRAKVV